MERDIAAICRKVARKVLLTPEQDRAAYQATITAADYQNTSVPRAISRPV
jgi:hypothetical protein